MLTLQYIFLSSLIVSSAALYCSKAEREEEQRYESILQRLVESAQLKFTDPRFATMFIDPAKSSISPAQQFLDAGFAEHPEGFQVNLSMQPFRAEVRLLDCYNRCTINAMYPRRLEIPGDYAEKIHNLLMSDERLLVAAVYRQVMNGSRDENRLTITRDTP